VDHIDFAQNGAFVMRTQNTYDQSSRLISRVSLAPRTTPPGTTPASFQYQYNAASQRTRVTLADGSYWLYGYDGQGQLTNGTKYFLDGTPCAGQQFSYAFDSMGNRLVSMAGGASNGAPSSLRQTGYTNNLLNQVTSRNVPPYVDVMGLTLGGNTVQVNGTNAYQKWEYFREQLGTNNASAAQWVGISVTAGQSNVSGNLFVARNPENFTYDADGNLLSDGRWSYTWDANNRLIAMTNNTGIAAGACEQVSVLTIDTFLGFLDITSRIPQAGSGAMSPSVIISRFGIGMVIPLNGPVPSSSPFCVSVFTESLPIGRFSGPHPQPLANPLGANRHKSASSRNTRSRRSPQPIM
jgi:YD repeat-containing protein